MSAGTRRIQIQDLLNPVLSEQVSIASGGTLAPVKEAQVLAQLAPQVGRSNIKCLARIQPGQFQINGYRLGRRLAQSTHDSDATQAPRGFNFIPSVRQIQGGIVNANQL